MGIGVTIQLPPITKFASLSLRKLCQSWRSQQQSSVGVMCNVAGKPIPPHFPFQYNLYPVSLAHAYGPFLVLSSGPKTYQEVGYNIYSQKTPSIWQSFHITSPSPSRGQRPIDIGDELLDFWMKFQERLYLTLVHPAFVPSFCSFGPRLVISKFKLWNCVEWRQWWAFQFPFHITTSPCKKDVKAPPAYDSSPSLLDIIFFVNVRPSANPFGWLPMHLIGAIHWIDAIGGANGTPWWWCLWG